MLEKIWFFWIYFNIFFRNMRVLSFYATEKSGSKSRFTLQDKDASGIFCKIWRRNRTDRKIQCDWSFSRHSTRVSRSNVPRYSHLGRRDDESIRSQFRFYHRRQTVSPTLCRRRSASGHLRDPSRSRGFPKLAFHEALSRKHPHRCRSPPPDTCLIEYERPIKSRKASSRHRDYLFRFNAISITGLSEIQVSRVSRPKFNIQFNLLLHTLYAIL